MRAWLTVAVVALALAAPGAAGAAVINGSVIDTTCYGPCIAEDPGHPFGGDAEILVRRRSDHEVVARPALAESSFRARVRPGSYAVKVIPYPDAAGPPCWEGSRQVVRLTRGERERVELTVRNRCIL